MATHSSIFIWRISWTKKPFRLQSIGSQTAGLDWSDWARMHSGLASLAAGGNARWCSSGPSGRGDSLLGALGKNFSSLIKKWKTYGHAGRALCLLPDCRRMWSLELWQPFCVHYVRRLRTKRGRERSRWSLGPWRCSLSRWADKNNWG